VGGLWTPGVLTLDVDGNATGDVTPTASVTRPDGSVDAPVFAVGAELGCWTVRYTLPVAGRYVMHVATPDDALDFAVFAIGPTTAAGMPNVNDCADYLGGRAGSWSLAQITDALHAEMAAQRGKCGERAPYPDDLRQALLRRVSRNLAMRMLPLAIASGDADQSGTILPGSDPEVRRFEAPWRKKRVG